jgi:GNAT superfamily N-acetyltransferase
LRIRRAVVDDAPALAGLSFRSKAHWGYDAAFMERVRADLTPSPEYIAGCPVYVAEDAAAILGFYGFRNLDGRPFLHDMFVEPSHIGRGVGAALWSHALVTARAEGCSEFLIESDPFAEPFYLRMGARRIGDRVSPATGRVLPLMVYTLG